MISEKGNFRSRGLIVGESIEQGVLEGPRSESRSIPKIIRYYSVLPIASVSVYTISNVGTKNLFSFAYRIPDKDMIKKKVVTQEWDTALVRLRTIREDSPLLPLNYSNIFWDNE